MKPFDLEAAKRGGKVVWYMSQDRHVHVDYIGPHHNYIIIYEGMHGYTCVSALELRMTSKKVTWHCRHYIDNDGIPQLAASRIKLMGEWLSFGKWHGEPFTIEVDE